jgi:putative hydrolase of the HAD superfamily
MLSDGILQVQQNKLESLGIKNLFDSIVFTDAINGMKSWKPAPDGFVKCCTQLETDYGNAVYIGDNPKKDFIGAKRIGMFTVRIVRKETEYEHVEAANQDYQPDLCISSFTEIFDDI